MVLKTSPKNTGQKVNISYVVLSLLYLFICFYYNCFFVLLKKKEIRLPVTLICPLHVHMTSVQN